MNDNFKDIDLLLKEAESDACKRVDLARLYYDNERYVDAYFWYCKAIELDNPDGINGLGCCYLFGKGVDEDKTIAKQLFEIAYEKGSSRALYNLANHFYKDHEIDFYTKAAAQGDRVAEYALGEYYMHNHLSSVTWNVISKRNTNKAFEWFMKSASHNYAPAQLQIGQFYEKGEDPCIRNIEKSLFWYSKAASQNNVSAMFALGRIYANGIDDLTPDLKKAYEYYLKAADAGEKEAQYRVGIALRYGNGVNVNKELSYKYLYKAAIQGISNAQLLVALSLQYGIGVTKNVAEAKKWFESESIDDATGTAFFNKLEFLAQIENNNLELSSPNTLFSEVTAEDLAYSIMDSYGILYSNDRKKLLKYSLDDNYESPEVGFLRQQTLNNYIVPNGVEVICDAAFEGCESIEHIELPHTIKLIGEYAFMDCTNLEYINLPESISILQSSTFKGCSNLHLCLPKNLHIIKDDALSGVNHVESYSDTFIAKDRCLFTKDLKTLLNFFDNKTVCFRIPNDVEIIGDYAFSKCNLRLIIIPESVTAIGKYAFKNCENLRVIVFEGHSSLKKIDNGAFSECYSLNSIYLPMGVEHIGIQAFSGCRDLNEINLPSTIKKIDSSAFQCTSLVSVVLPKELYNLGTTAFTASNIQNLESQSPYFIVKNMTIYDKDEKTLLQYYGHDQIFKIPENVENIENYAFADAWSIRELIIPNNVRRIGKHILEGTSPKKIIIAPQLYEAVIKATDKSIHNHITIADNNSGI